MNIILMNYQKKYDKVWKKVKSTIDKEFDSDAA